MAKKSVIDGKVGERKIPVTKTTTATVNRAPETKMAVAKAEPKKSEPKNPAPTTEEIAKRAFEIYMGRGQTPGRETEDWAQAERELRAEAARNN